MLHDTSLGTTGVDASIFSLNLSEVENVSSVSDVMVWLKANPEVSAFVELKPESIEEHGLLRCVKTLGVLTSDFTMRIHKLRRLSLRTCKSAGF